MINFFCKILQHPQINPRSAPDYNLFGEVVEKPFKAPKYIFKSPRLIG